MIDVKTCINDSQEKMDMAIMYLEEALAHIRAGKASTRLLDGIRVDSYGSMVPLGYHARKQWRNYPHRYSSVD